MQPGHPFFDRDRSAQFQSAPGRPLVIISGVQEHASLGDFQGNYTNQNYSLFACSLSVVEGSSSRRVQSQKEQSIIRQQVAG
jgi:hypothetical protein